MARSISYETKIKQCLGHGSGKNYKPWYKVGENVRSNFKGDKGRGNGHRLKGLKTKRIHHLLSNNELLLFIVFDLNPDISDIREQFPILDISSARTIAADLGISYPNYQPNHILTSDFLIDYKNGKQEVITFKPLSHINRRQLELFQIERIYWTSKGVRWNLMTDLEIPKSRTLLKNYQDIYNSVAGYHNSDFPLRR